MLFTLFEFFIEEVKHHTLHHTHSKFGGGVITFFLFFCLGISRFLKKTKNKKNIKNKKNKKIKQGKKEGKNQ